MYIKPARQLRFKTHTALNMQAPNMCVHPCAHTHIHTYTHTHTNAHTGIDKHTHVHARTHTYIHTSTRTHVHTYIHTRTCIHIRTHTPPHTHTHTRTHTQASRPPKPWSADDINPVTAPPATTSWLLPPTYTTSTKDATEAIEAAAALANKATPKVIDLRRMSRYMCALVSDEQACYACMCFSFDVSCI